MLEEKEISSVSWKQFLIKYLNKINLKKSSINKLNLKT